PGSSDTTDPSDFSPSSSVGEVVPLKPTPPHDVRNNPTPATTIVNIDDYAHQQHAVKTVIAPRSAAVPAAATYDNSVPPISPITTRTDLAAHSQPDLSDTTD